MTKKRHISEILKPGAKLTTKILPEDEERVRLLIQQTIKEQDRVLALKKIDYEKLRNTYITI